MNISEILPWVIVLICVIVFIVKWIKGNNITREVGQINNNQIFEELLSFKGVFEKSTKDSYNATNEIIKIFSNNQLRGRFGEEVAEDLLKLAGFVKGIHYDLQEQQADNTRPDITLRLPKQDRLNIDVKFPYQAYEKLIKAESEDFKKKYKEDFQRDVKEKLKEVKKYISLEENTLNFVMVFIPNEMIFSYIYNEFSDIWKDSLEKKIYICGPLSFIAVLSIIKQAHENFRCQKNISKIVAGIKLFENEVCASKDKLISLGENISKLSKLYDEFASTRTKKLEKIIDQIKSEESLIN